MNYIIFKILAIEEVDINYNIKSSSNYYLEDGKEVYNNDGSFSHIRIDDNISVNICNSEIKKQLKSLVGKSFIIIENGNKIYIAKDFPGEFMYSKSSLALNNKNKSVKSSLIPYLDLIIENSSNKFYSNDHKVKHVIDAKYGFYKYKFKFSILNNNIEEFYTCFIVIRNDANKKKYLYDIISIKK